MKTQQLAFFQYNNEATTMLVKATEFEYTVGPRTGEKFWTVTIIEGGKDHREQPTSRSNAVEVAEHHIARFVGELAQIYCKC